MNSRIVFIYPKSKLAFTLAEVLITLMIIGIVAALSIPSLINSFEKSTWTEGLKKSYAVLSQATQLIISENGDMPAALNGISDVSVFANVFTQKLNVLKNCGKASTTASGCFPNINYKRLSGSDLATAWGSNLSTTGYLSTFTTNDGMSYAFYIVSTDCTSDWGGGNSNSPLYNTCGVIYVDVNGPNKPPAKSGRDLFIFYITKKGLYPRGSYPDIWGSDCSINGHGCAGKVLNEGAMNY